MPDLPYPIGITATKADSTAYVGKIWLYNNSTNDIMSSTTDSDGKVVFDAANFNSGYTNGDVLTYAVEAYADPGYHLVREAFDDSSVEMVEFGDEKLNTATCVIKIKVK